jgi:hypothetical protein
MSSARNDHQQDEPRHGRQSHEIGTNRLRGQERDSGKNSDLPAGGKGSFGIEAAIPLLPSGEKCRECEAMRGSFRKL